MSRASLATLSASAAHLQSRRISLNLLRTARLLGLLVVGLAAAPATAQTAEPTYKAGGASTDANPLPVKLRCWNGFAYVACSMSGGGGGGGDASALNQNTQIGLETAIRDRLGDTASPAAGSTNARLGGIDLRLQGLFKPADAIGNTFFGARLQDATGAAFGTAGNPLFTTPTTSSAGAPGSAAPANATQIGGRTSAGNLVAACVSAGGVLCAPAVGTANSTGTVTAVAANTSTTVCPATTNPVVYEVQIYGTGGVLLGLDGQALTATTPAAGSGAFTYLPTQYTQYTGPVARTNAITAYTATAQTVSCNIITRP